MADGVYARAVEAGAVALNGGNDRYAMERWDSTSETVVRALDGAGLLAAPQGADEGGLERSDPDKLIEAVAERLRDFLFEVGPNTLSLLNSGQKRVRLTSGERHALAHAAVQALLEER